MAAKTRIVIRVVVMVLLLATRDRAEEPQGVVVSDSVARLHIRDPMPLLEALFHLSKTFGWRIGFEEARLTYLGDLVDMTSPKYTPKNKDDRAYLPRGGPLDIQFPVNSVTQQPDQPGAVIRELLAEYERRGYPGKYSFTSGQGEDAFIYVFPEAVANAAGVYEKTTPISSIKITILVQENEKVIRVWDDACRSLQSQTGKRVLLVGRGMASNLEFQPAGRQLAAHDEATNSFLNRAVAAVGSRFWQLLYDPGQKYYLLGYR